MTDGQHLGAVRVSGELLRDGFFREGPPDHWYRTASGIPADAEFVRMWVDESRNQLVLVYRHPSFPLCLPGCHIADLPPPLMLCLNVTEEDARTAYELWMRREAGVIVAYPLTTEQVAEFRAALEAMPPGRIVVGPPKDVEAGWDQYVSKVAENRTPNRGYEFL